MDTGDIHTGGAMRIAIMRGVGSSKIARPAGVAPGGRAGGQSKHRQKPRPRRARRSVLIWPVTIPSARNSRPITSRQTPISSAI